MIVDEEVYLEHYGVKGMQWGVRRERRAANRALNKESKAKEKAAAQKEFDSYRKSLRPKAKQPTFDTKTSAGRKAARRHRESEIDRARERINSGAARADKREARQQFRQQRQVVGSREARRVLWEKRAAIWNDADLARQTRDGAELASNIIAEYARVPAGDAAARSRATTNALNESLNFLRDVP